MNTLLIVELLSVVLNLIFLFLYIQEKKVSWIFGIVGSLTGAYVVHSSNLYSETLLYFFYAGMGVFAYIVWSVKEEKEFKIKRIKPWVTLSIVVAGIAAAIALGYHMSKTNAEKVYYDSLSTVFGVITTFLEIYKYHIAWSFWIVINLYTIVLYATSGLYFYAGQSVLFTIMSVYGLREWRGKLALQK